MQRYGVASLTRTSSNVVHWGSTGFILVNNELFDSLGGLVQMEKFIFSDVAGESFPSVMRGEFN